MSIRTIVAALAGIMLGAGPALAQSTRGEAGPIPDTLWDQMVGASWHADLACPTRDDLRLLIVPYTDFHGARKVGQLITAADVAQDVLAVFEQMHRTGFRIFSMDPVSAHGGDDDASMAANNTSGFNCRLTSSGTRLSEHSFGKAIDINPVQNPYVTRSGTYPPPGDAYDTGPERDGPHVGLIHDGDAVVQAFAAKGWKWGGHWRNSKDYQHFSTSGR